MSFMMPWRCYSSGHFWAHHSPWKYKPIPKPPLAPIWACISTFRDNEEILHYILTRICPKPLGSLSIPWSFDIVVSLVLFVMATSAASCALKMWPRASTLQAKFKWMLMAGIRHTFLASIMLANNSQRFANCSEWRQEKPSQYVIPPH